MHSVVQDSRGKKDLVKNMVQDFQQIEGRTVDSHNERFESDAAWLAKEVQSLQDENSMVNEKKEKRSILVISHHAPCVKGTSHPQHNDSPINCAFASDVVVERDWPGVKVWVYGHTHYSTDFKKRGIRIVSNQRGYVFPNDRRKGPQRTKKEAAHIFIADKKIAMT